MEHSVNTYCPVKPGRCAALGVFDPKKGSESLVLVAEEPDGGIPATKAG